ncbi:MAG: 1-acyl-sn-glycerol-3-phosphate acyltransferase [Prevotella sp.]|nr:1-acyl-sn-glycerol-3-phosphate acyltransferase [Prevotella sp.]MDY4039516.1 1-acyl-sn-glycerol-3-phosphate acyltransferase [Prevotella sp.]
MVEVFLKIHDWLNAHKKFATGFLLIQIVVLALLAWHANYEEDISKFLPRNERNAKLQQIYQAITSQNRIAVIFSAKDSTSVESKDSMKMAMDFVGKKLLKHRMKNLQVSFDEHRVSAMANYIYRHIPMFLEDADYERMDSLLAMPGFVHQQMFENRLMLLMPAGGMLMPVLQYDPLHLFTPVMNRLQNISAKGQYHLDDGYIFSPNGNYSLITFDSPYGPSETRCNTELAQIIDQIRRQAENAYPSIRISAIGAPLVAVTNASQIKQDAVIAVSIAVVLILLLLVFRYRSVIDILWIVASLSFGWLFALAGIGLFKDSISIIVLGIGSIIIGIAVNYPLHYLDHLRGIGNRRETLKEMIPPLLIGNITTVAAFLCLLWLDAQAMRDLGLFGSLMLVGTIIFVLIFLPIFAKAKTKPTATTTVTTFPNWHLPHIPYTFAVILVVTVILSYFSLQTSFDSDISHINYMTAEQKRDMYLLASSVDQNPVYAVAEGRSWEEALTNNELLNEKIKESVSDSDICSGPGDFLPSQLTRNNRIDKWNQFWKENGRGERLIRELQQQGSQYGFKDNAFYPFDSLMHRDVSLNLDTVASPIMTLLNNTYIFQNDSIYQIVNVIHTFNPERIIENLQNEPGRYFTFGKRDISNQLVEMLNDSFNYIGFVCSFVVFIFLWLSFRNIELAIISFLPLAVSWIWILGTMQLLGIQFNIVNVILATFIFGQGDDYTIFITEGLIYEYATGKKRLASYKHSVLFSALLMFIGIGCLIFSKHPALRSLGEVTVVGMFTVVMMAYYLPPFFFRWMTLSHGQKRPVPVTLKRLCYSIYSLLFFLIMMYGFMLPYTWLYFHIGKITEKKRLRYHRLIQRVSHFIIRHVPGVDYSETNTCKERFKKPAIIICNHQSHLDLMCLLQLTPKMVFVTNDWVWHNPFYGAVIHHAEFYPISDGMEKIFDRLSDLYQRGYSICIFPEGTRSEDCSILRFHKGAFFLARELNADLLPIFLHGAGHVLPKKDFMLREGSIHVEIGTRIRCEQPHGIPANEADRLMTRRMRQYYISHYKELCNKLETDAYWAPYRKYNRMYKGGLA